MKRKMVLTTLAMILFEGVVLSAAPTAQAGQCSLADVAGKWAHTYTGTAILPTGAIPLAAVGTHVIDAQGNFSGIQTRSVGGDSAEETIQGTVTVHPDCTGTLTADVSQSGQLVRHSVLAFVYDDNQRQLRFIFKSVVLPGGTNIPVVITGDAKRIFTAQERN